MANLRKTIMDISEIIRRWQSGQSVRAIKGETGYDRETIAKYISLAQINGLKKEIKLTPEEIKALLPAEIPKYIQKSEKIDILLKHAEEFKKFVTDKENPLNQRVPSKSCQRGMSFSHL